MSAASSWLLRYRSRARVWGRGRGRVAGVVGLALVASLVTARPVFAAPASPRRPDDPATRSVPVSAVRPKAAAVADSDRVARATAVPPVWPAGGTGVVAVDAAAAGAGRVAVPAAGAGVGRPGGLGVRLRAAADAGVDPRVGGGLPAAVAGPASVLVSVAGHEAGERAGVRGVLFALSRADGVGGAGAVALDVDYLPFRGAYGGDYASRLRLVRLPGCVLSTPERAECRVRTPVSGSLNVESAAAVSVDRLAVAGDPSTGDGSGGVTVLAVTSSTSSGAGDFSQTSLSPTYSWSAGDQGGEFSYRYPLRVPPSLGGPAPDLALTYSSGSVDGRTLSTSGQASMVGEGWDLPMAYIERSYRSCADDGGSTPDLCWFASYNATMVFNGRSYRLVKDDTTFVWHAEAESGLRIEQFYGASNWSYDGEYWRVTTPDGTQYYFGRSQGRFAGDTADTLSAQVVPVYGNNTGEPCHQSTFAASSCHHPYRWNLDYVVDPRGNSMTIFYDKYVLTYGHNNGNGVDTYDSAGWPVRIEYGTRAGQEGTVSAPMKVTFGIGNRCFATLCEGHVENWPDTPWDLYCGPTASICSHTSPTFWTPRLLSTVTTSVWNAGTGAYRDVDRYQLSQSFPSTGDYISPSGDDTSASLWLSDLTHTGLAGTPAITEPVLHFGGTRLANRVDWGADVGVPPLMHYRITQVLNGVGGQTTVAFKPTECTRAGSSTYNPDQNPHLCFPQYFTLDPTHTGWGWFHKYLVDHVSESDLVGGGPDETWSYGYGLTGTSTGVLWHHDDNEIPLVANRSWSDWRGYSEVTVTHGTTAGAQTITKTLYFRGLDGDRTDAGDGTRVSTLTDSQGTTLTDSNPLQGVVREESTYDGANRLAFTLHDPTVTQTAQRVRTWQGGTITAYQMSETSTRAATWLAASSTWRWTRTDTSYDTYTLPVDVHSYGDTATSTDDTCSHTDYARNTTAWLVNYPSQVTTTDCTTNPAPANYLAGSQTLYDGTTTVGAAPTQGLASKTLALASFSGTTPVWAPTGRATYDSYGRPALSFDGLDRQRSTTIYSPASGGPLTQVQTINAANWVDTTTLDPAWGATLTLTDVNAEVSTAQYDALGRRTNVWLNNRSTAGTPDLAYTYTLQSAAPSWASAAKLGPNGNQITTYQIYDGRLRPRQTQTPAPPGATTTGGRVVSDVAYDNRGLAAKKSLFYNSSAPGSSLLAFNDIDIVRQLRETYDGLQRQTVDALYTGNGTTSTLKYQTTWAFDGDRVTVTPPAGGIMATTISNALGKTVTLRQYLTTSITGSYQDTGYSYDRLGRQTGMTDPAGNIWTTAYDLRGRVTATSDPDKGASTSSYDDANRLLSTTDSRGITLSNAYDTLDRKTALWQGTVGTGTLLADWTYDPVYGATTVRGQLGSTRRYSAGNTYTTAVTGYDDGYRPLGSTVTLPAAEGTLAGAWTTSSTYNVDGSPATTTYPAGGGLSAETVAYGYDNATGMPLTLSRSDNGVQYVQSSVYYYWGAPRQLLLGSSPSQVRYITGFNEANQRLSFTQTSTQASPTPTWTDQLIENYLYSSGGTVKSITEVTSAGATVSNQCFTYDKLQQLQEAWTTTADTCQTTPTQAVVGGPDPYWTSYRYDNVANRTSEVQHAATGDTTRTYAYPAAGQPHPHAVQSVTITGAGSGADSFGYDNAGNTVTRSLSNRPAQTITWDPEGHVASVVDTAGTTGYLYDSAGNRLMAKDPDGGATLYLPGTEIHRHSLGALTATRYYTHNGKPVASRTASALTWLTPDRLGTAQLAIDAGTLGVTRRKQDPFGNPRGTVPAWPNPHGYVGGISDATGLTHLGAREYDPTTGRLISVDPVLDPASPQQTNGYAYANNNPTTSSDPTGQYINNRACPDGDCRGVPPTHGIGYKPPAPPCTSHACNEQKQCDLKCKLQQGAFGNKKPSLNLLHEMGYTGSDAFTYQDALNFASQSREAWTFVCEQVFGGSSESCANDPFISKKVTWKDVVGGLIVMAIAIGIAACIVTFEVCVPALARGELAFYSGGSVGLSASGAAALAFFEEDGNEVAASLLESCNSFDAKTPVLMADGTTKPIKEVAIGDRVEATDPVTGVSRPERVVQTHTNVDTELADVTVVDTSGHATTLSTTRYHRFWNLSSHRWVVAGQLRAGDRLFTDRLLAAYVVSVRIFAGSQIMHNLTISELHTYYVVAGGSSILVHNVGLCGNGLKNASAGLLSLFDNGSVRGKSIIEIRATLLDDGFVQDLTNNKSGYLFTNSLGEEVRVMSRSGGWDIRIRNQYGNYLDEFGNVATPANAHGIDVYSR